MDWTIRISKRVGKQIRGLPLPAGDALLLLLHDLREKGPMRHEWPHFGKLSDSRYHCHIRKGRPTFVAVWAVEDKSIQLIEVEYVGTHEGAPY